MSEEELRSVNHIPPRSIIKAGSTILVPRSAAKEEDVASHVADNGQIDIAPETLARRTVIKVTKAESVNSVAKRYRLTPTSVAEWNKVAASASFAKGQQVVLFLPSKGKLMARASGPGAKHARRAAGKPTRMAKR